MSCRVNINCYEQPAICLLLCASALLGQSYTIATVTSGYPPGSTNAADSVYYSDLTVDSAGNIYFAVSDAVFKISHGMITQVAGKDTIFFPHYESGLGVGADGSLYISNADEGCDVVKILNGMVTEFAGSGASGFDGDGGPAALAALNYPKGVVEDSAGRVYIADGDNNRVRMVSGGIITTVAGNGEDMRRPSSVAIDAAGNLYIADSENNFVKKLSNGKLVTVAGTGLPGFSGDGGLATNAQLNLPYSVAVDAAGNLYIADVKNNRIRKVSGGMITTIAGDGTDGFRGDGGPATSAWLNGPRSVGLDAAGNVYISDARNNRIRVLTPTLRSRNSASYATATAPDMIALGESTDLTSALTVVPAGPWPTILAGVSVRIIDSEGQILPAPMYFVGNGQFGYLVPGAAALGRATLELTTAAGTTSSTPIDIERVAAGLYSANSDGAGVASGIWIRVSADGAQTWGYLFDPAKPNGARVAVPVDLGAASDQVYLSLYGTGFRAASNISATIGGVTVPVSGFGAVSQYQGEDQVNIGPLPISLAGRGEMDIVVTFDGKAANRVTASIR